MTLDEVKKLKIIDAEGGFIELLHMVKELEFYASYGKGENLNRRKVDGFLKDFNDRLDSLFLKHTEKWTQQ
jgi:hypothetical protein